MSWKNDIGVVLYSAAAIAVFAQATEKPHFGHVGEGFTSRDRTTGIEAGYRMFTAPTIHKMCAESGKPHRLISTDDSVVLRAGAWFDLRRLIIVGVDQKGSVVRPAPISIEVEDKEPPLLNLQSDMISDGRLMAIRPGKFQFRARTICEEVSAEVFVEAVVRIQ
jgi:hypothetical protein